MRDDLHGHGVLLGIARRGMKPHGYTYEGGSSRLARFSGLSTNSTVVYHRADVSKGSRPSGQRMCGTKCYGWRIIIIEIELIE